MRSLQQNGLNNPYSGEELASDKYYYSGMNDQQVPADFLTAEQKETLVTVRNHLQSVHNIDTSSLNEREMTTRMAVIVEIAKSRHLDSSQLPQVLDEFSDKFMDFTALVMEMIMTAEGARH